MTDEKLTLAALLHKFEDAVKKAQKLNDILDKRQKELELVNARLIEFTAEDDESIDNCLYRH